MATPKATAQQLVVMALRKLGVVNRRQPVNDSDMQAGLEALWMLLESFNVQNALIPCYTVVSLDLTSTQREYTIGPNGDFDMDVPMDIIDARISDGAGMLYPVDVLRGGINYFNNINPNAGAISGRPQQLIWNPSTPCGTITLDVVPDGWTLELYCLVPWSVDMGSTEPVSTGQAVDPSEFSISTDPSADSYCNDECQLNVTSQMTSWLETQVDYGEESYTHDFEYNGLTIPAIATREARTTPAATSIGVPRNTEFPMGYSPLIMWSLAEALLSEYPQSDAVVVQSIVSQAALMRRHIQNKNNQPQTAQLDPSLLALQTYGSVRRGYYRGP